MIRWNDPDAREHVVVGEHHALGVAGRARREHELEHLVRLRALPRRDLRLPVGRERVVRAPRTASSTLVVGNSASRLGRVRRVAAGAEQQPHGARRLDDVADRLRCSSASRAGRRRAARTSRRSTRRAARASRAPREHPVTRLQPQRAQPPRREARPAPHLAVAPVEPRPVVAAQAQRAPVRRTGPRSPRGDRPGSPWSRGSLAAGHAASECSGRRRPPHLPRP